LFRRRRRNQHARRVRSPESYRRVMLPNEMNAQSNALPQSAGGSAPGCSAATRPFYWSVCRELWENRSLYVAPVLVAIVVLFGFLVSTVGLPERRREVLLLDPAKARAAIEMPYTMAAIMLILTAFIVGLFYCLDALYGERRDRSILFWKSLPVSDSTTLLSKATIPLVVLPLVTFAIVVATQVVMMLWTSVLLISHGMSPSSTWTYVPLFRNSFILLYGLAAIALWHAPIYGWALLVSGWARRATFLWAVVPLLAIGFFEKITFGTSHFASMLKDRLMGFAPQAFAFHVNSVDCPTLTPGRYLSSPGLWIGLVFAAVFIAVAIRLRRYRGPL
jgi:ABC-2 type transport system permease protein